MDSIYPRRESAFELGCNYWPRLSGPRMWRDFDEAQIAEELELIRASGMTTVRAFCFWPDFMPTKPVLNPKCWPASNASWRFASPQGSAYS